MRDRKNMMTARPPRAAIGIRAGAAIGLFAAVLCFPGCTTIPRDRTAADWLRILPEDCTYYLCLNTARSKDLAKAVVKKSAFYSRDIELLIDFTERVFCGVKIEAGRKPSFSLALLGNYPLFLKSSLASSKEMEPIAGGAAAFRHKKTGLQIAVPEDYLVVVTPDNVAALIRSSMSGGAYRLSASLLKEMELNDVTLLFPHGLDELVGSDLGLSLSRRIFEEIWLGARLKDNKYYFTGVFNVGPDVDAASFKKLLQFFFLALLRRNEVEGSGKRLAEMEFLVEERMIKVSNFFFTKTELETLVSNLLARGL